MPQPAAAATLLHHVCTISRPGPLLCAPQPPTHLCQPLLVLAIPKVDHAVAACTQRRRQHARGEAEQRAACCGACLCCKLRAPAACPPCRPAAPLPPNHPTSYRLLHVCTPHAPPVAKVPKRVLKAMAFTGYTESLPPSLRRWHLKAYLRAWQGAAGGGGSVWSAQLWSAVLSQLCKCIMVRSPRMRQPTTPATNKGIKPRRTGPRCIDTPRHTCTSPAR